ncbi:MAG: hypothetical protein DRQ78_12375 [Epsilonproteobacteria bacterium]|nr:MAG: hypothetical protein DRQ78_12375 [Campylobacterota bacterium]
MKINSTRSLLLAPAVFALLCFTGCGSDNNEEETSSSVKVVATAGECTSRSGTSHAASILFFGENIKNTIATSNEVQKSGGELISQDTDVTFDVWESNGIFEGTCVGNITIHIDGGTNERAQVSLEDYLPTPTSGQGVLVRSGQLDLRKKMDSYVDVTNDAGERQMIWSNFTGLPNASRVMSAMRFVSGQHLAIYFTGTTSNNTTALALIQLFRNDGTYVGVATQNIGKHSAVVTDAVRNLTFIGTTGLPLDTADLPADGEGFLKILGSNEGDTEASCLVVYTESVPNAVNAAWSNDKLPTATLTYARRNNNNAVLNPSE